MFTWNNDLRRTVFTQTVLHRRLRAAALLLPAVCLWGCKPRSPEESQLIASVASPADQAVVEYTSDVDPSTEGLQVDVIVSGTDTGDRPVQLESAELILTDESGETTRLQPSSVDGDTATFAAVTLPGGTSTLVARIEEDNRWTAETRIEVTAARNRPSVVSLGFPQDVSGDGILNLAELPENAAVPVLRVTSSGMPEGGTVLVRSRDGAPLSEPVSAASNGITDVPLHLLGTLGEANVPLAVELRSAGGNRNNLDSPSSGDPLNVAAQTTLRVDRVPPALSFLAPGPGLYTMTGNLLLIVEATGAPSRQVLLSAQVGTGAPVELPPLPLDSNGRGIGTRTLGHGVNSLTASVTDEAGNPAQATTSGIRVTCSIAFTAPADGPWVTLGVADDEDQNPDSGLNYTLRGVVRNCEGQPVTFIDPSGFVFAPDVRPDGTFAVEIQMVHGAEGTFVAAVRDTAGVSTNASTTITVDMTPPRAD